MSTQVMGTFEDLEQRLIDDRGNLPDGVTINVEAQKRSFIAKNSDVTSVSQFTVTTTHHALNNGDMPQDFIEKIYTTVINGVLNNVNAIKATNNLPEVIKNIHQAVEGVLNNTQWSNSPLEVVEVALQNSVQNAISSVTGLPADVLVSDPATIEWGADNTPVSEEVSSNESTSDMLVSDQASSEVTPVNEDLQFIGDVSATSSGEVITDGVLVG